MVIILTVLILFAVIGAIQLFFYFKNRKVKKETEKFLPMDKPSITKEQTKIPEVVKTSKDIEQVFDVYLEPLNFIEDGQIVERLKAATSEGYYGHSVAPGVYNIIRCNITREGFVIGTTSVSLIRVTVSQPILAEDFFKCSKNPSESQNYGLSVDYLNPQSLTQNQRSKVVHLLSQFCDSWWKNAAVEVKKFLSGESSSEDEALDICRVAGLSYQEKNLSKAKKLYNKAISTFSGIGGARISLGEIALDEGDLRTALRMFYDELEHAKNPSKDVALLYLYEINSALGYDANAFIDLKEFYEVRKKICLPSDTINKIRLAAQREKTRQ